MDHINQISNALKTDRIPAQQVENKSPSDRNPSASDVLTPSDQAEFSELGKLLSLARELPDVRLEKVTNARAAIAQNEQNFIQDRLEGTVDRLLNELLG